MTIDPFEQGLVASAEVKSTLANPYTVGTAAHQEWLDGHEEGDAIWSTLCGREVTAGRPHPDA